MPVPLWRNRDFLLLWTGQVGSTLGSRISGLAFALAPTVFVLARSTRSAP